MRRAGHPRQHASRTIKRTIAVLMLIIASTVGVMTLGATQSGASAAGVTTRAVINVRSYAALQPTINACRGPVYYRFSSQFPALIAQHNYCGGMWMTRVRAGNVIRIAGHGVYRANGVRFYLPHGATLAALRGRADAFLQTCVGNYYLEVGLVRIG